MFQVLIILVILLFIIGVVWLFFNHGIDRIKHPEEWNDTGKSGERILYNTLIKQFKIPEKQILRNVYIPTKDGKTTEIDLLVISKKGLLVFEVKNYGGNIYGDAKKSKWIQYIGNQKNYFYNPIAQNKNHAKHLKVFLSQNKIEVPIISLVSTIARGKWKIKNLNKDDYFLGINCHLKDVYNNFPDSLEIVKHYNTLLKKLSPLSRPEKNIREKHITNIKTTYQKK